MPSSMLDAAAVPAHTDMSPSHHARGDCIVPQAPCTSPPPPPLSPGARAFLAVKRGLLQELGGREALRIGLEELQRAVVQRLPVDGMAPELAHAVRRPRRPWAGACWTGGLALGEHPAGALRAAAPCCAPRPCGCRRATTSPPSASGTCRTAPGSSSSRARHTWSCARLRAVQGKPLRWVEWFSAARSSSTSPPVAVLTCGGRVLALILLAAAHACARAASLSS